MYVILLTFQKAKITAGDQEKYTKLCGQKALCTGSFEDLMEDAFKQLGGDLSVDVYCCEGNLCNFSPATATYSLTLIIAAAFLAMFKM